MQRTWALLAVTAALLSASVSTTPALAAAPKPHGVRSAGVQPAKSGGDIGARSASSGARSGDFTGDGLPDILARQADNGVLKVYPHGNSFDGGLGTFQPAVTINHGWSGFRWIGAGRITDDALADVVSIDVGGTMRVYPHSGTFDGLNTLGPSYVLSYGWNINDLVFLHDFNGDGRDDIIARRAGTEMAYIYRHLGNFGEVARYSEPQPLVYGVRYAVDLNMADVTFDGYPDLLYLDPADTLRVFSFPQEANYTLGYGFTTLNFVGVNSYSGDAWPDLIGRRHNGELVGYRHSQTWNPADPLATFQAPTLMGYGWNTNNVIS
ncbi:FG-GAP repeat domain-containing protein [Lentzea kentuckyensis]|uniref:FG-GAP repeat domain-containing protein n=1 Tax=Lentzea kentuckyensis TaxID=360086 RepID=UPI000A3862BF|nr:VCBS repeat-containing protein [Lentzea kentuckyensis]